MSEETKSETQGCGDPNCANCGTGPVKFDQIGKTWEAGLETTFDRAFETTEEMVAKGETPFAMCCFIVGNKGSLCLETAGAIQPELIDLVLSEIAVQVADILHARALRTAPDNVKAALAKIAEGAEPSKL